MPMTSQEATQHTRQKRLIALIQVSSPPTRIARSVTLGSLAREQPHQAVTTPGVDIAGAGACDQIQGHQHESTDMR